MKKTTRHHVIPKSKGGNNHFHNIRHMGEHQHTGLHWLFENQTPHEQISTIVDITGKAFNKVFADDIMSVVNDYNLENIYNTKCVNVQKLVNSILGSKNS